MNKTILHTVLFFRECRPPPCAISRFILIAEITGKSSSFTDENPLSLSEADCAPDPLTPLLPPGLALPLGSAPLCISSHRSPTNCGGCGCLPLTPPLSPAPFPVSPCTGQLLPISFLSINATILASSDTRPCLTLLKVALPKVTSYLLVVKPSGPLTAVSLLEGRPALCNMAVHSLFVQLAFLWPVLAF